jgi:hypothetical protein
MSQTNRPSTADNRRSTFRLDWHPPGELRAKHQNSKLSTCVNYRSTPLFLGVYSGTSSFMICSIPAAS